MNLLLNRFVVIPVLGLVQILAFTVLARPLASHGPSASTKTAMISWLPLLVIFMLMVVYLVKFLRQKKIFAVLVSLGTCVGFQIIAVVLCTMIFGE